MGDIFKHENKPSDFVKKKGVGLLTNRQTASFSSRFFYVQLAVFSKDLSTNGPIHSILKQEQTSLLLFRHKAIKNSVLCSVYVNMRKRNINTLRKARCYFSVVSKVFDQFPLFISTKYNRPYLYLLQEDSFKTLILLYSNFCPASLRLSYLHMTFQPFSKSRIVLKYIIQLNLFKCRIVFGQTCISSLGCLKCQNVQGHMESK